MVAYVLLYSISNFMFLFVLSDADKKVIQIWIDVVLMFIPHVLVYLLRNKRVVRYSRRPNAFFVVSCFVDVEGFCPIGAGILFRPRKGR